MPELSPTPVPRPAPASAHPAVTIAQPTMMAALGGRRGVLDSALTLGVAKVALGWPMVLIVIWLSWLVVEPATKPDGVVHTTG